MTSCKITASHKNLINIYFIVKHLLFSLENIVKAILFITHVKDKRHIFILCVIYKACLKLLRSCFATLVFSFFLNGTKFCLFTKMFLSIKLNFSPSFHISMCLSTVFFLFINTKHM